MKRINRSARQNIKQSTVNFPDRPGRNQFSRPEDPNKIPPEKLRSDQGGTSSVVQRCRQSPQAQTRQSEELVDVKRRCCVPAQDTQSTRLARGRRRSNGKPLKSGRGDLSPTLQQHNTTNKKFFKPSRNNANLISPIPCTFLHDRIGAADMFDDMIQASLGCIPDAGSCRLAGDLCYRCGAITRLGTSSGSQREKH